MINNTAIIENHCEPSLVTSSSIAAIVNHHWQLNHYQSSKKNAHAGENMVDYRPVIRRKYQHREQNPLGVVRLGLLRLWVVLPEN